MLLDTCKSGQAAKSLGALLAFRGMAEQRALAVLARASGVAIAAATTDPSRSDGKPFASCAISMTVTAILRRSLGSALAVFVLQNQPLTHTAVGDIFEPASIPMAGLVPGGVLQIQLNNTPTTSGACSATLLASIMLRYSSATP